MCGHSKRITSADLESFCAHREKTSAAQLQTSGHAHPIFAR